MGLPCSEGNWVSLVANIGHFSCGAPILCSRTAFGTSNDDKKMRSNDVEDFDSEKSTRLRIWKVHDSCSALKPSEYYSSAYTLLEENISFQCLILLCAQLFFLPKRSLYYLQTDASMFKGNGEPTMGPYIDMPNNGSSGDVSTFCSCQYIQGKQTYFLCMPHVFWWWTWISCTFVLVPASGPFALHNMRRLPPDLSWGSFLVFTLLASLGWMQTPVLHKKCVIPRHEMFASLHITKMSHTNFTWGQSTHNFLLAGLESSGHGERCR